MPEQLSEPRRDPRGAPLVPAPEPGGEGLDGSVLETSDQTTRTRSYAPGEPHPLEAEAAHGQEAGAWEASAWEATAWDDGEPEGGGREDDSLAEDPDAPDADGAPDA